MIKVKLRKNCRKSLSFSDACQRGPSWYDWLSASCLTVNRTEVKKTTYFSLQFRSFLFLYTLYIVLQMSVGWQFRFRSKTLVLWDSQPLNFKGLLSLFSRRFLLFEGPKVKGQGQGGQGQGDLDFENFLPSITSALFDPQTLNFTGYLG